MGQFRRRQILIAAGMLLAMPCVQAQQDKRLRHIGYFSSSNVQGSAAWLAAFREGMAALNWVERRDYVIDARYGNGVTTQSEQRVIEILATQPDLLLVSSDENAFLLNQRTKTIPIVFANAQDPIERGLATSLRHPGGNATGLTNLSRDLVAKRLQLLKEAFPRVVHVAQLFEPTDAGSVSMAKEAVEAAARQGMRVTQIKLAQSADIEPAFKRAGSLGVQAFMTSQGGIQNKERQVIADHMLRSKVPAIFGSDQWVDAGGLMSYGPSFPDNFRRAAGYVDKILKGAKPGDLPIEQPIKFEMVVNMKTAKAMGFTIPQSILLRADRLIE
jgi:putative ABC transport system substrate-binding protein